MVSHENINKHFKIYELQPDLHIEKDKNELEYSNYKAKNVTKLYSIMVFVCLNTQ